MSAASKSRMGEYLPPPDPPGPRKWLRENLFDGWFNAILTLLSTGFVLYSVIGVGRWLLTDFDWRPITGFPTLYAVGQYPRDQLWRVAFGISLLGFLLGLTWARTGSIMRNVAYFVGGVFGVLALLPVNHSELTLGMRAYLFSVPITIWLGLVAGRTSLFKGRAFLGLWLLYPVLFLLVLRGFDGVEALEFVRTTAWGGLLVTFILSVGGILLSFPIGVALALGRRSTLPVVKAFSTIFIETIRGVPLITLLFMFSVILALFLPPEARLDRLVRALMAVTFFSAAYTAENVRGGLQAVPQGQIEAAQAVGMNNFQITSLIVLPQAIRAVIPAIVGQFISLFKDTTRVVIVGINDLLGIGRSIINSDPEYVQAQLEVYLFIAVIYWIFSYFMSLASRRLESSLGVGQH